MCGCEMRISRSDSPAAYQLLAPPKPVAVIGRKVAIAWKAGVESARAITAASPILSRAEEVFILAVSTVFFCV